MDRDTTMPSILGPASGYEHSAVSTEKNRPDSNPTHPLLKIVIWAVVGVTLLGLYRFFVR